MAASASAAVVATTSATFAVISESGTAASVTREDGVFAAAGALPLAAAGALARDGIRQRMLQAVLPVPRIVLQPPLNVAERVLSNMVMSVSELAQKLGPGLSPVLKRALPYDSANPLKPALMLELMPSVGATKLGGLAWAKLSAAFSASPQTTTPFVLVTGVSGMGKTKVAYDIGLTEAFVVVSRVVECDSLTPPWEAFRAFAAEVIRTAASTGGAGSCQLPPLTERIALKAALIVLLGAHMEWAVSVSEAAVAAPCAAALDAACAAAGHDRARVLQELVLRAQRNGLAYQHVTALFRDKISALLNADAFGSDGTLQLSVESALAYVLSVAQRAKDVWGRRTEGGGTEMPRILWAHDEVQALLSVAGLPSDLFTGVYAASPSLSPAPSPPSSQSRGCFYGLLAAIREVVGSVRSGHLLLGNSLDLSAQVLGRHSPVQGVADSVEEAISLTAADIRALLDTYLTPAAMEGVDTALLEQLRGRAVFASHFWTALVGRCSTAATAADLPERLVHGALTDAVAKATAAAELIISALWERYEPDAVSGQVPSRLLRHMFHELIMASGADAALDTARMRMELLEAIQRGLLNANAKSIKVELNAEPCMAAALRAVGMHRLARGEDGIMALLAARVTEPPGGEDGDLGPAQESCFAWELVRRCLLRPAGDPPMTLGELLGPYFARVDCTMDVRGGVHPALLPSACDDYEVILTHGCRADGPAWSTSCPLDILRREPDALVHHMQNRMGGPDIMFLVRHRFTRVTRPVLLQLKNRATASLAGALPSVDMASWYAECEGGAELRARAHMRTLLAEQPQWALPIRGVVGARPVDARVLLSTAWLNRTALASSPVLFMHLTRDNLRADIASRGAVRSYGITHDWPRCLWPTPWDAGMRMLPVLPPCPPAVVVASLKVKLAARAPQDAMVRTVEDVARRSGGSVDFVRHRYLFSFNHTVTATFAHAAAAFEVVRRGAENTLTVDGRAMSATFV